MVAELGSFTSSVFETSSACEAALELKSMFEDVTFASPPVGARESSKNSYTFIWVNAEAVGANGPEHNVNKASTTADATRLEEAKNRRMVKEGFTGSENRGQENRRK